MPADDDLVRMYDNGYFDAGGAWVCGFWSGSYVENESQLRDEARGALARLPIRGGRLLEIGCAGGFFLDEAREAGFEVIGCELNAEMAEFGRERLRLTIHDGLFEHAGFTHGSFDVVVVQDVLEHTRDPVVFARGVQALLRPGGLFFVRGPLEDETRERVYHFLRKLTRRGVSTSSEPPFHLQGFTERSFKRTMERAGFHVERFVSGGTARPWNFHSPKEALATLIELVAYQVDRLRGGGDFMTATAVKP